MIHICSLEDTTINCVKRRLISILCIFHCPTYCLFWNKKEQFISSYCYYIVHWMLLIGMIYAHLLVLKHIIRLLNVGIQGSSPGNLLNYFWNCTKFHGIIWLLTHITVGLSRNKCSSSDAQYVFTSFGVACVAYSINKLRQYESPPPEIRFTYSNCYSALVASAHSSVKLIMKIWLVQKLEKGRIKHVVAYIHNWEEVCN